jgi:hypothetical protein
MQAGGGVVVMRPGELWVFSNKAEHAAWNDTSAPRIHPIFDHEPRRPARQFEDPRRQESRAS